MTVQLTRATAQGIVRAHAGAAQEILGIAESIPQSVDAGEASDLVADAMAKVIEQLGVLAEAHGGVGSIVVGAYSGLIKTEDDVVDGFANLVDDVDPGNLDDLVEFGEKP